MVSHGRRFGSYSVLSIAGENLRHYFHMLRQSTLGSTLGALFVLVYSKSFCFLWLGGNVARRIYRQESVSKYWKQSCPAI